MVDERFVTVGLVMRSRIYWSIFEPGGKFRVTRGW